MNTSYIRYNVIIVLTILNLPKTISCTMSEGHYLKNLFEKYSKDIVANMGFIYFYRLHLSYGLNLVYSGLATGLFHSIIHWHAHCMENMWIDQLIKPPFKTNTMQDSFAFPSNRIFQGDFSHGSFANICSYSNRESPLLNVIL